MHDVDMNAILCALDKCADQELRIRAKTAWGKVLMTLSPILMGQQPHMIKALELADSILSNPSFRLTTPPAREGLLALDRGMLANSIKRHFLEVHRSGEVEMREKCAHFIEYHRPSCFEEEPFVRMVQDKAPPDQYQQAAADALRQVPIGEA